MKRSKVLFVPTQVNAQQLEELTETVYAHGVWQPRQQRSELKRWRRLKHQEA